MDGNSLDGLFAAALSNDNDTRRQAESAVLSAVKDADFLMLLIQYVSSHDVHGADSKAYEVFAALTVKNAVVKYWSRDKSAGWTPEQRVRLRGQVLANALSASLPDHLQVFMRAAVSSIARTDWTGAWPELFPSLLSHLESAAPLVSTDPRAGWAALLTGLATLNSVVKEVVAAALSAVDKQRLDVLAGELVVPVIDYLNASCAFVLDQLRACAAREDAQCEDERAVIAATDAVRKCLKTAARLIQASFGSRLMLSPAGISLSSTLSSFLPESHDLIMALVLKHMGVQGEAGLQGSMMANVDEVEDAVDNMGEELYISLRRCAQRSSWACVRLARSHGVSYACTGSLTPVLMWAATQVAGGKPMFKRVLADGLVVLSIALDMHQRLGRGEAPSVFETSPPATSATDVGSPAARDNGEWAGAGVRALHDVANDLFANSVVDSWLASLISNCLQVSDKELREEWGEDSELATQVDTHREQGEHPRSAAEALLCALIADTPEASYDRVSKIFAHAQSCEQSLLTCVTSGQDASGALMQLEGAWLACGIAAADAMMLQPPVMDQQSFLEWCCSRLFPVAHLLGVDVHSSVAGTPFQESVDGAVAALPAAGTLLGSLPVQSSLSLRRLFWMFSTCLGLLPSTGGGSPSINPMRVVLLRQCMQVMGWSAQDTGLANPVVAAARLGAATVASAVIEDCRYADPTLNSPGFAVALASAVYSAVPTLQISDSKLQLLSLLQHLLTRMTSAAKVASIQSLLGPLAEVWAGDAAEDAGLLQRSILGIVTDVVEAFPAVHPPDPRPSPEDMSSLLDSLTPLVIEATSVEHDAFVYTLEDGLKLLQAMVEAAPGYTLSPTMAQMYGCLQAATHEACTDAGCVNLALRIATDFILRAPAVTSASPSTLPALLRAATSTSGDTWVPVMASSVHVCAAVLGAEGAASVMVNGLTGRLIACLALSIQERQQEQASVDHRRGAMLAQLQGRVGAGFKLGKEAEDNDRFAHDDGIIAHKDQDTIHLLAGVVCTLLLHAPDAFLQSCAEWAVAHPGGLCRCGAVSAQDTVLTEFLGSIGQALSSGHTVESCWAAVGTSTGIDVSTFAQLMALRLLVLGTDCLLWCLQSIDIGSGENPSDLPSTVSPNGSALMGYKLVCLATLSCIQQAHVQSQQLRIQLGATHAPGPVLAHVMSVIQAGTGSSDYDCAANSRLDTAVQASRNLSAVMSTHGLPATGLSDRLALYGLPRSPARPGHGKSGSLTSTMSNDENKGQGHAEAEAEELSTARSRAYLQQPEVRLNVMHEAQGVEAAVTAATE